MKKIFSMLPVFAMLLMLGACTKEKYAFGDIKAPTDLVLNTEVVGTNTSNPNGDGSGSVKITASGKGALSYKIDYGNGITEMVPEGAITYKYTTPGTNSYTITMTAIGTGGAMSTLSKRVTVFVNFQIPTAIMDALTGGGTKVWITDKDANGHFGVGPTSDFSPIWYAATPNSREACAYDDEISFVKNSNNTISMTVDNKGTSMSIGASTAFYGFSGGDGCYAINTGGTKQLAFSNATSASTPAVSTRIQFTVPGNGIINFGTGGTTYEILSATATTIHLRNIGSDGNAWYQKLKVK
ncbi:MAG: PKD domain-containing protein [Chitinophagales bacterium]|nr:PKD domain-containing protein [Chitinophagales bacterium]